MSLLLSSHEFTFCIFITVRMVTQVRNHTDKVLSSESGSVIPLPQAAIDLSTSFISVKNHSTQAEHSERLERRSPPFRVYDTMNCISAQLNNAFAVIWLMVYICKSSDLAVVRARESLKYKTNKKTPTV